MNLTRESEWQSRPCHRFRHKAEPSRFSRSIGSCSKNLRVPLLDNDALPNLKRGRKTNVLMIDNTAGSRPSAFHPLSGRWTSGAWAADQPDNDPRQPVSDRSNHRDESRHHKKRHEEGKEAEQEKAKSKTVRSENVRHSGKLLSIPAASHPNCRHFDLTRNRLRLAPTNPAAAR